MRIHLTAIGALALAAASCCATTSLAPSGTQVLRAEAERSRELVVPSAGGGETRIRPKTWIRFVLVDGQVTPWFKANRLRLSRDLVVTTGARVHAHSADGSTILRWDRIAATEVNDYDLTTTLIGVAVGVPAVMAAATVEVALMCALTGVSGGLIRPSELGITRAAMESVIGEIGKRPPDAQPPEATTAAPASVAPAPPPDLEAAGAQPLFSRAASRRDLVRLSIASDLGAETSWPARATLGVLAVARINNTFEVGGGFRMFAPVLPVAPAGTAPAVKAMPVLRLGWHVDLDARRRLALPLVFEAGPGSPGYGRLIWGLRIRLGDRAQLGLYPWNPTVFPQPDQPPGAPPAPHRSSGYVTTIDLAWIM